MGLLGGRSPPGALERCWGWGEGDGPESRLKEGDGYLKQPILSTARNSQRKGRRAGPLPGRGRWRALVVQPRVSRRFQPRGLCDGGVTRRRPGTDSSKPGDAAGTRPARPAVTAAHPALFPFPRLGSGRLGATFGLSLVQTGVLPCAGTQRGPSQRVGMGNRAFTWEQPEVPGSSDLARLRTKSPRCLASARALSPETPARPGSQHVRIAPPRREPWPEPHTSRRGRVPLSPS